jgi:hypothetical protein
MEEGMGEPSGRPGGAKRDGFGSILAAVGMLLVAVPLLGFTACGLFFGLGSLFGNGATSAWPLAALGLGCAALGGWALAGLLRAMRALLRPPVGADDGAPH